MQLFLGRQAAQRPPTSAKAQPVSVVGVLGAGQMGGGIAQVAAANGVDVVLKDRSLALATRGKKQVWTALDQRKEKDIVNRFRRDRAPEWVVPTDTYAQKDHCDFIIEAVPETRALKTQVLANIAEVVSDDALLATNTSSSPVSELADVSLVEMVVTEQTADETLATAFALARAQDKLAVVVKDSPGFYTTRILTLYLNEALLLLEEGADVPTVNQIMREYGFPMGALCAPGFCENGRGSRHYGRDARPSPPSIP